MKIGRAGLKYRSASLIVSLLLFAFSFGLCDVAAQSGRAKGSLPPVSPPSQQPTGPSKPDPRLQRIPTIVSRHSGSTNVALWTEVAFRELLRRLRDSADLDVEEAKEMTRKEAVNLAKISAKQYVVWIHLELDVADTEKAAITQINPACLVIFYELFQPASGKVKALGKVYQRGYQSVCVGGVYSPSPFPTGPGPRSLPAEYTVKQASRQAADRIITAFDLPLPPAHP